MATGEMTPRPSRRPYRSPVRRERAQRTRAAILSAAHDQFVARGYAGTSMRGIAAAAGVSVPSVEQQFGTKRHLLKQVLDLTKAGDDEPVPMLRRAAADDAAAASTAEDFLRRITGEISVVSARVAAIVTVVTHAAAGDAGIAELARENDAQRLAVAAWIVDGVAARGGLRPGLAVADAVDSVWVLLDPVVHRRLTHDQGRTTEQFAAWLLDALRAHLVGRPQP